MDDKQKAKQVIDDFLTRYDDPEDLPPSLRTKMMDELKEVVGEAKDAYGDDAFATALAMAMLEDIKLTSLKSTLAGLPEEVAVKAAYKLGVQLVQTFEGAIELIDAGKFDMEHVKEHIQRMHDERKKKDAQK